MHNKVQKYVQYIQIQTNLKPEVVQNLLNVLLQISDMVVEGLLVKAFKGCSNVSTTNSKGLNETNPTQTPVDLEWRSRSVFGESRLERKN